MGVLFIIDGSSGGYPSSENYQSSEGCDDESRSVSRSCSISSSDESIFTFPTMNGGYNDVDHTVTFNQFRAFFNDYCSSGSYEFQSRLEQRFGSEFAKSFEKKLGIETQEFLESFQDSFSRYGNLFNSSDAYYTTNINVFLEGIERKFEQGMNAKQA